MKSFKALTIIICMTAAIAGGGCQNSTEAEILDGAWNMPPLERVQ